MLPYLFRQKLIRNFRSVSFFFDHCITQNATFPLKVHVIKKRLILLWEEIVPSGHIKKQTVILLELNEMKQWSMIYGNISLQSFITTVCKPGYCQQNIVTCTHGKRGFNSRWSVLQKSSSFWVSCTPSGTNSFGVKTSWYSPRRPILKYRCTLCAKIFLFRRWCNGTQKSTPEVIDYNPNLYLLKLCHVYVPEWRTRQQCQYLIFYKKKLSGVHFTPERKHKLGRADLSIFAVCILGLHSEKRGTETVPLGCFCY